MLSGFWGRKIGMTQIFSDDFKSLPVTVIDCSGWYVTQIKTEESDGYDALQLGRLKKRYASEKFSAEWLSSPKRYFEVLREIKFADTSDLGLKVGDEVDIESLFEVGSSVDVFGFSIGKGFQGVVKRYNYAGGPASHGHTMGRTPGALGGMTACGKVIKGKKMPGHMGNKKRAVKNLKLINIEPENKIIFVKGSIPGKTGSLVFVRKCR